MLDYKDIINKHYALNMSGREIAKETGVSKSGVNGFLTAFARCKTLSFPLPKGITNQGTIFDSGYTLGGKSTTIILGENLKYIIALLNSKLSDFAINILYNSLKMSGVYLNIGTRELENFPIPPATKSQQQPIISLVDQILEAKKSDPFADTSALES